MLGIRLCGAIGALLLALAPLSAQASSDGADSTPDCHRGRARGAWDLPVKDEPGLVRGLLGDLAGHRLALEARLTPGPDGGGRIDGILTPITAAGLADRPIAAVHGLYKVGELGSGRFEARILGLATTADGVPKLQGRLEGAFEDPMDGRTDPVGRFAGRWIVCR